MILYHGSNVEVAKPRIVTPNRALDFGPGFYATSSLEQAKRWATLQTRRRRQGAAIVSAYEFDEPAVITQLDILRFEAANAKWLHYVAANRRATYRGAKHDVVIGPVANDNTMPVINEYMAGSIDEQTALVLLRPQKLANQYAFLTAEALEHLDFAEAILL